MGAKCTRCGQFLHLGECADIQELVRKKVLAERDRCVKLCLELKGEGEYQYNNACQDCADAILGLEMKA